jgi:hypothetical protein
LRAGFIDEHHDFAQLRSAFGRPDKSPRQRRSCRAAKTFEPSPRLRACYKCRRVDASITSVIAEPLGIDSKVSSAEARLLVIERDGETCKRSNRSLAA